ncbi:MAG: tRNA (adenosine(37)-N6)-threonylcarbamoyltransferase complex transferase subunit TsaD [Oscillospiraceae bacterium]|nr:tRNA (adenosine(37)-N6)-threonylcarbamoyltransferase complex transferase subunit TsaD [Oscillospiraceae bacterium]
MKILAIESSCDETCAAVVEDGRYTLSNVVASQIETHALYGGVVPEIASRAHSEAIWGVTEKALADAGVTLDDIDAVAVTSCPGLIGALLVGVSFAKSLAYARKIPLIPVHHIRAHIAAAYTVYNGKDGNDLLEPPFVALVVSGGHTSLIHVSDYTHFEVVGATRDDAAGECFDKVARLFGFTYPGGAKLDKAANGGDPTAFSFPDARVKDSPYDFSFSGLKTAVINLAHHAKQVGEELDAPSLAASFCGTVASILSQKFYAAAKETGDEILAVAGGVSANSFLRSALLRGAKRRGKYLYLPELSLCGDNAAMIGAQAYYEYQSGVRGDMMLNAVPYLPLDEKDFLG